MPSKKHYSRVPNNEFDLRIPLYSDEAFRHGITFQAQVNTGSLSFLCCVFVCLVGTSDENDENGTQRKWCKKQLPTCPFRVLLVAWNVSHVLLQKNR